MKQYVHHVPGRLRVKSHALKRNAGEAAAIRTALMAIDGVLSAEVNLLTGSLTVRYDPQRCAFGTIATYLEAIGQLRDRADPSIAGPTTEVPAAVAVAGRMLLRSVLEKLVERSAVAMVAAII